MTDHLHTPEAKAAQAWARRQNQANTRPTTRTGSETCDWKPGQPVRVVRSGDPSRYSGRHGFVATVNTQQFPDGRLYTEVGVTWSICKDWARASAETWFRVDELTVP